MDMKKGNVNLHVLSERILQLKYFKGFVFFFIAIFLYSMLIGNIVPDKLNIKLYQTASKDIISPLTIENKKATEKKQQEAADAVSPQYVYKRDYAELQSEQARETFNVCIEAQQTFPEDGVTSDQLKQVRANLPSVVRDSLSDESLSLLLSSSPSQLEYMKELSSTAINEVMDQQISVDGVKKARENVANKLASSGVNEEQQEVMMDIAQLFIRANYVLDTEATKLKKQEAKESVNPVIIREGQVIVREGQMVTRDVYQQLEAVGLLENRFNPFPYIGLLIFVSFIVATLVYVSKEMPSKVRSQNTYLVMFTIIFLFTMILMKSFSLLQKMDGLSMIVYLVPVAFGTMMVKMLINNKMAFVSAVIFGMTASIIFNSDIPGPVHPTYGFYVFFSSLLGIMLLDNQTKRSKILQTGLYISLFNLLLVSMLISFKNGHLTSHDIIFSYSFAAISGITASILTLGSIPVFETVFKITSSLKLIELANPNHPLLRKILMETPGTYHHSVMVANLAEAACESIGADGLVARVGAYYHDIGKTKRPHFFIENQMNMENPHDKISPQLSKKIIIAHPYDGRDMLQDADMPDEIVQIAEQHHGTTLLKFFYYKAKKLSDQEILEEEFRYPGPKAQTKEAAIVGIADCVEAAVRSLSKPTPQKIETLVRSIIRDRLEDGQFDECDLTLSELNQVAISLFETLQGIFHQRIEYPEDEKKKVKKA